MSYIMPPVTNCASYIDIEAQFVTVKGIEENLLLEILWIFTQCAQPRRIRNPAQLTFAVLEMLQIKLGTLSVRPAVE